MEHREYNGWTNYETWCVNLWLSNDKGDDDWARNLACESLDTEGKGDIHAVAQALIDRYDEELEQVEMPGMFLDLLRSSLSEVNWQEIAEAYVEVAELEWKGENSDE